MGSILELLGDPKWYSKLSVFVLVSGAPPWTILGPLLAPFYGVFGLAFEVFWRFFGDASESWFEVVF